MKVLLFKLQELFTELELEVFRLALIYSTEQPINLQETWVMH
jgi:hypothetical protein